MIPIYRAKVIDSDKYIVGYLRDDSMGYFYIGRMEDYYPDTQIDPTTLAIHFPDMVDSQGNKIFASLQKDGRGGDILDARIAINCTEPTRVKTIKYTKPFRFTIGVYDIDAYRTLKVIGIQE